MNKTCGKCKQDKPLSDFYRRKTVKVTHGIGSVKSMCKACNTIKGRAYIERHRELQRLKLYGLASEEFNSMLTAQGDACAICRATDVRWYVDHDHETGAVRGILCLFCNSALGFAKDSTITLRAAAEYLEGSRAEAA